MLSCATTSIATCGKWLPHCTKQMQDISIITKRPLGEHWENKIQDSILGQLQAIVLVKPGNCYKCQLLFLGKEGNDNTGYKKV